MSAFIDERLKGVSGSIPLSSVCNSNCLFCSNHQNPFKIKRIGHLSFEEFRKQVYYMKSTSQNIMDIGVSDVLPGTISEGEAMLNPEFRNMIMYLKKSFGPQVKVKMTTNGGLLDDNMIEFLSAMKPFEVSVSIPSFTKQHWLKMFGSSNEQHYENAIVSFTKMRLAGIEVRATIVPLPALTGFDDLEHTITRLVEEGLPEILVWYPGYTKHTPNKEFVELVEAVSFTELHDFFGKMKMKHDIFIREMVPDSELNSEIIINQQRIRSISEMIYRNHAKKVLWFTSDAAHVKAKKAIEAEMSQFPQVTNLIYPIKNLAYGGNIRCCGLITVQDVLKALEGHLEEGVDLVVFPPNGFLNRLGEDISGESFFVVEDVLKQLPYLFV